MQDTPLQLLDADDRILVEAYRQCVAEEQPHLLLDVREPVQYEICHLPGSLHIPLRHLKKRIDEVQQEIETRKLHASDGKYCWGGRTGSEEKKRNEDCFFDDKAAWLSMNESR